MAEEVVQKKKKKRRKKHYFLRFLIFAVLIAAAIWFLSSSFFDVQGYRISGNIHYTDSQIKDISGLQTGKNILFETNLRQGRNRLLDTSYIKIAKMSRELPGTVVIEVSEREEFACVPYGDGYIIIDSEGLVLRSTDILPELPILDELTVLSRTDGAPLEVEQSSLLNQGLKLLIQASENDFYFQRISLNAVSSKAYIYYDSYYCQGTMDNILENVVKIKVMVGQQYQQNIQRGCIVVGSNNYLSFTPQID